MKKLVLLAIFGALIVGCSKNSPEYISEDYTKALQERDFRRAKSYIYVPRSTQSIISQDDIDIKLREKFNALQKELVAIGGVKEFKIVKEREVSKTVTELQVECHGNNGNIIDKTFHILKNEEGKYKIIESLWGRLDFKFKRGIWVNLSWDLGFKFIAWFWL